MIDLCLDLFSIIVYQNTHLPILQSFNKLNLNNKKKPWQKCFILVVCCLNNKYSLFILMFLYIFTNLFSIHFYIIYYHLVGGAFRVDHLSMPFNTLEDLNILEQLINTDLEKLNSLVIIIILEDNFEEICWFLNILQKKFFSHLYNICGGRLCKILTGILTRRLIFNIRWLDNSIKTGHYQRRSVKHFNIFRQHLFG